MVLRWPRADASTDLCSYRSSGSGDGRCRGGDLFLLAKENDFEQAEKFVIAFGGALVLALTSVVANAQVSDGDTNVSCSSSSYALFDTFWHRTSGAMSFWDDYSGRTVDVRLNNGNKYNYASNLSSGDWKGFSSAKSPIGFWSMRAKADTITDDCNTFHMDYSYVHNPW